MGITSGSPVIITNLSKLFTLRSKFPSSRISFKEALLVEQEIELPSIHVIRFTKYCCTLSHDAALLLLRSMVANCILAVKPVYNQL